jgi:hypothetical protein
MSHTPRRVTSAGLHPMASISLDIQSELPKAIRWTDAMTKQLPWMIAKAMTESSKKAQAAVKAQAQQKIQGGPTPFTRNSTFVKFASPRKLESSVGFKDFASKGTPAAKYLQPIVAGEPRRAKRSEISLRRAGILRPGEFIVPTGVHPLRLNQYGNLSGATYTQVLSRLRALGESGYSGNVSQAGRSQRKRSARDYFVGQPGGLPRGIYARVGRKPSGKGGKGSKTGGRPTTTRLPSGFHTVFYITRQPNYQVTFPVDKILVNTYRNNFPVQLRKAIEAELQYQAMRGKR